jgi:hypothetical protein
MSLDPHTWQRLQNHGMSEEHLDMLLAVLDMRHNGSWTFHFVNGMVQQSEVRISVPKRSCDLERSTTAVSNGLQRVAKRA